MYTLLKAAALKWNDDDAPTAGAAIAFYTIFSLAPVLLIVIAISGAVFGEEAARGAVYGQIAGLVGSRAAETLQDAINSAGDSDDGMLATVIGTITFLVSATTVFVQLQSSLNTIWKARKRRLTMLHLIQVRLLSFSLILTAGFLFTVSLVLDAAIVAFGDYIFGTSRAVTAVWVLQQILTMGISAGLFAVIFKLLPDAKIGWRAAGRAAIVTALLFNLGKFLIGFYLAQTAFVSGYGAAGTFILVLLWVYYSSQIFLFGAEIAFLSTPKK